MRRVLSEADHESYNARIAAEVVVSGMARDPFATQNEIIVPCLLNLTSAEQKERWLPSEPAVMTSPGSP